MAVKSPDDVQATCGRSPYLRGQKRLVAPFHHAWMGTSRAVTRRDPGVRYPHYPPTRHLGARVLSKQLLNVHNREKEDGSKKCCLCDVLPKAPEHLWARWPAQDDRAGWSTRRRSPDALRRHTGARGPDSEHGDAGPAYSPSGAHNLLAPSKIGHALGSGQTMRGQQSASLNLDASANAGGQLESGRAILTCIEPVRKAGPWGELANQKA